MLPRDITGRVFGRLTAVRFVEAVKYPSNKSHQRWEFRCDCGNLKILFRAHVVSGLTKSCGCVLKHYLTRGERKAPLTQRQKYIKHRHKRLFKAEIYRREHKEQIKSWQKNNRDLLRVIAAKRRALQRGVTVNPAQILEWIKRLKKSGVVCYYCGIKIKGRNLTVDHVVPLVENGEHAIGNLAACCFPCNCRKNRTLLTDWPRHGQRMLPI